ncbi:MAG: hypothetical protein KC900_11530 [Candidatus Omnitrophica bacterium]|nr:hypothetical protein [Candidatus Omnitrophota bacterium]
MDLEKAWNAALKETEIIRARVAALPTATATSVPYVLLAESSINVGDTVVRTGEVKVDKPSLILPPNNPQFEGFEFDQLNAFNQNAMVNFLLIRGVSIPSFRYDNRTQSISVFEGDLSKAAKHFQNELSRQENVSTGLIKGSEEYWPFSVLIFTCTQVARNADIDIRKLLERFKDDHP